MTFANKKMHRKSIDIDAYLRVATTLLIDHIDSIIERLLSFLPSSTKQPLELELEAIKAIESPCTKDLEVQCAINEVLEYHHTLLAKEYNQELLAKAARMEGKY